MKKEAILSILKNLEIELDAEKEKEFVLEINKLNDADIQNAKKDTTSLQEQIETLKAEIQTKDAEIKDKSVNAEELNALKDYKSKVESEKKSIAQQNAIKELLKSQNFDSKVEKLLSKAVIDEYNPNFDDEFKITNSDEIAEKLKNDYGYLIVTEQQQGANPAEPKTQPKQVDLDKMDYEDYVKYRKSQQ